MLYEYILNCIYWLVTISNKSGKSTHESKQLGVYVKNSIIILILLFLLTSCKTTQKSLRIPENTNKETCAISKLIINDNFTIGKNRESSLTRRYYRPYIEANANTAFFESCSERYDVVPDSSLKRIVGVNENLDTIMNRLATNNIRLLILPSITAQGSLKALFFINDLDSVYQFKYQTDPLLNECRDQFSQSNLPAFKSCVYDVVKVSAIEMLDSLDIIYLFNN